MPQIRVYTDNGERFHDFDLDESNALVSTAHRDHPLHDVWPQAWDRDEANTAKRKLADIKAVVDVVKTGISRDPFLALLEIRDIIVGPVAPAPPINRRSGG